MVREDCLPWELMVRMGRTISDSGKRSCIKSNKMKKAHFERWAFFDSGSRICFRPSVHQLKIHSNKEKWSAAGFVITGRESSARVMVTVSVAPEEGTVR